MSLLDRLKQSIEEKTPNLIRRLADRGNVLGETIGGGILEARKKVSEFTRVSPEEAKREGSFPITGTNIRFDPTGAIGSLKKVGVRSIKKGAKTITKRISKDTAKDLSRDELMKTAQGALDRLHELDIPDSGEVQGIIELIETGKDTTKDLIRLEDILLKHGYSVN